MPQPANRLYGLNVTSPEEGSRENLTLGDAATASSRCARGSGQLTFATNTALSCKFSWVVAFSAWPVGVFRCSSIKRYTRLNKGLLIIR